MTDRKIGTFLSGGLDSSLITALVNRYNPYTVNTYSVGMAGATDFKFAAKVARHLNTNHHEVVFSPEQGMRRSLSVSNQCIIRNLKIGFT